MCLLLVWLFDVVVVYDEEGDVDSSPLPPSVV